VSPARSSDCPGSCGDNILRESQIRESRPAVEQGAFDSLPALVGGALGRIGRDRNGPRTRGGTGQAGATHQQINQPMPCAVVAVSGILPRPCTTEVSITWSPGVADASLRAISGEICGTAASCDSGNPNPATSGRFRPLGLALLARSGCRHVRNPQRQACWRLEPLAQRIAHHDFEPDMLNSAGPLDPGGGSWTGATTGALAHEPCDSS